MSTTKRYLTPIIDDFLKSRMVFLGGPRQVGKTTLCLQYLSPPSVKNSAYLNWDNIHDRTRIKNLELPPSKTLVIDEIHKYKNWRPLIKGLYDKNKEDRNILVTGSARLDHYRKGGDSLFGRYRYLRLHPFSISELGIQTNEDLKTLLTFGGFPEPFLKASEREWKLWTRERLYKIINDDISNLENIKELSQLELLAEALPEKVGNPLSINNLSQDLENSGKTIESWIKILEQIYYCFRILPYGSPKIRAVKKEKKLYLWDWSTVKSPGYRLENMVASHLLKYCHFLEDSEGELMELRYLRDTDKREIDFVVLKNNKPIFAVECKTGDKAVSPHIHYFKARTSIPHFYQVHMGTKDYQPETGIRVLPFIRFCSELALP